MKTVEFTLKIVGDIPDSEDESGLFVTFNLSDIKVQRFTGTEEGQEKDVPFSLGSYDTVSVERI